MPELTEADLERLMEAARAERTALRIQFDRAKANALTCVWCQYVFADLAALRQHTATCASHPVAAANAEIARLRALLERCRDAMRLSLTVIDGLAGQQAMDDDTYLPRRGIVAALLAELEGKADAS